MLAILVAAARQPVAPTGSEALEGIGQAFSSAIERDGRGVIAISAVLAAVIALVIVRWLRREARHTRGEERALDERRKEIASQAPARLERRAWVRVPAHLVMTVVRTDANARTHLDTFETQNLGAGGIAFLSHAPPATGTRMELTLDLGERSLLVLSGVVVRVDPPPTPEASSLVALRFGDVENAARERLMKWIAAEEMREIAEARRGRLCALCRRPLADSADAMHSTCATRVNRPNEAA